MTTPAAPKVVPARSPTAPPVAGVRADGSLGVALYADRLAEECGRLGGDYVSATAPLPGRASHFHLANSSRGPLRRVPRSGEPFAVTVHDVVPRTRLLEPAYRALVYPLVVGRAAAVVVHSRFSADLLRAHGARPRRLEIIPSPATRLRRDRAEARRRLGLPDEGVLFVLPGVLKQAKLVAEAVAAAAPLIARGAAHLVLVGRTVDRAAVASLEAAGIHVLPDPDDDGYADAVAAADVVLVLRNGSVGETNGPLLDALGASRAVLATPTGSIPETAGEAALFCDPTVTGIRAGMETLLLDGEREARERLAAERAADLSPAVSARMCLELFAETLGA